MLLGSYSRLAERSHRSLIAGTPFYLLAVSKSIEPAGNAAGYFVTRDVHSVFSIRRIVSLEQTDNLHVTRAPSSASPRSPACRYKTNDSS